MIYSKAVIVHFHRGLCSKIMEGKNTNGWKTRGEALLGTLEREKMIALISNLKLADAFRPLIHSSLLLSLCSQALNTFNF